MWNEPHSLFGRLTCFLGMFFASAINVGGEGGAGAGEGTGGGTAVADEGTEVAEGAEAAEGTETTEGAETTEGTEEGEAERVTADGRMMPDTVKKGLNKLRETDPKLAGELRKIYFQHAEITKVFPSVAEARAAADLIESVGGETGIGEMQQEVNDYAAELTAMSEGNPKAVNDLARDFPKGLVKLTPLALDHMKALDSVAYDHTIARHMAPIFRDKGVTGAVTRLIELIADGKQAAAAEAAERIKSWMAGVEQLASTRTTEEPDARTKELEERERGIQTKEQRIFTGQVASAVSKRMYDTIDKHVTPYLKQRKLTPEQRTSLRSGIGTRISKALEADKQYQGRLRALLDKGDVDAVARFVGSHVDLRVQKAVQAEWNSRGFAGAAAQRTAAAGGKTAPIMGSKPNAADIDWSQDRDRSRYQRGEATLIKAKGGKVVKWNWDRV
jgi:hypothetical protein